MFSKLSFVAGVRYSRAYKSRRILINYALPRIYAAVLTISVGLFFNPLECPLLCFSTGYILVAALAFYLRSGYKARVSRL